MQHIYTFKEEIAAVQMCNHVKILKKTDTKKEVSYLVSHSEMIQTGTDAYIWIHYKLNAYFHPRDMEEFGESSILQHGLEFIYIIVCVRKPCRPCICMPMDLFLM